MAIISDINEIKSKINSIIGNNEEDEMQKIKNQINNIINSSKSTSVEPVSNYATKNDTTNISSDAGVSKKIAAGVALSGSIRKATEDSKKGVKQETNTEKKRLSPISDMPITGLPSEAKSVKDNPSEVAKITNYAIDKRPAVQKVVEGAKAIPENLVFSTIKAVNQIGNYKNAIENFLTKKIGNVANSINKNINNNSLIGQLAISFATQTAKESTQIPQELIDKTNQGLSEKMYENTSKAKATGMGVVGDALGKGAELASSLGSSLVALVGTAANPLAGTALFMMSAGGDYLDDARARGMNDDQSLLYSTIMMSMEGLTEEFITKGRLKNIKLFRTKQFEKLLSSWGIDMLENAIQEAVIEPISEGTAYVVGGKNAADFEGLGERTLQAGIDGALSEILFMGIEGTIGSSQRVYDKLKKNQKPTELEIKQMIEDAQKSGIDVQGIIRKHLEQTGNILANEVISNNNYGIYQVSEYNGDELVGIQEVVGTPIELEDKRLKANPVLAYTNDGATIIDGETGTKLTENYSTPVQALKSINEMLGSMNDETVEVVNKRINNVRNNLAVELEKANAYMEMNKNAQEALNEAPGKSEFYNKNSNYEVQDIDKTTSVFKDNKNYTDEQIYDIEDNLYYSEDNTFYVYDTNNKFGESIGHIEFHVNDNNQLEVHKISDATDDTIEKITIQPNKDNKFSGSEINNAIRELVVNNENAAIEGQTDIEGNIVTNKAKKNVKEKGIQGLEGYSRKEIKDIARNYVQNKLTEEGIDATIKDLEIIGSRNRGDARANSDLDVVVEYSGDMREDDLFNILNDSPLEIEGIKVDINPITEEKTGTLKEYLAKSKEYDKMKQNENVLKSIERFEKATDTISRQDIINIAKSLKIYHKGNTYINKEMADLAGKNISPKIVNIDKYFKMFTDNEDLRKQAYDYALAELKNKEVNIKDINKVIDMAQKGLKKTFNKNQDNVKMQTANNLIDIIQEGIYLNSSNKDENSIYHYFFAPVLTERGKELSMITITEDLRNIEQNNKFYYHDLRQFSDLKKNLAQAMSQDKSGMLFEQDSLINNSISQNKKSVNKTIVDNNDMQKEKNNTNIQDFGEKIGGARKDLSIKQGEKTSKEVIHNYTVQPKDDGYAVYFKKRFLQDGFKTQQEAEQYILDFKNNIKSNMATVEKSNISNDYIIKIRNPRTLKTTYTNKKFANLQDAESYAMALSMYLKEHSQNLFRPQIQKIERVNQNNKNATRVTGDNIINNFGFRGGEFGNWVKQSERQQFLNYAQDAFTDLAEALEVMPESLGQKNAMAIAFGARGKGLSAAVAHFEPAKKVINMTRLKGAGSLAHEYGHSIDNYLSREGGYTEDGMATTNSINPKLSENMKKAVNNVVDAMVYNTSKNEDEIAKKNEIFEKNRKESLQFHMNYLDKVFAGEAQTYKYNRKTKQHETIKMAVTEEQKQKYKKIKKTLLEGKLKGEIERKTNFDNYKVETIYPKEIESIREMYKDIVGRKIDDDRLYWLNRYGRPARQVSEVKSESAYSKSSKELDQLMGRKTPYYSKTEEMWARAFESYVNDKLKVKGITNTYLVHSVNNDVYALFNPFPAGEERQNINKAFDNLIRTMKKEGLFKNSQVNEHVEEDNGIRYMKMKPKTENSKQSVFSYDSQGRELSKEQQEYFKDSKLRNEKNKLEVVYHTTPNTFTEFDDSKLGDNTFYGNTAFGHFVTTSKEFSKRFGDINNKGLTGHTMEMYANIKNPIIHPYNAAYKYNKDMLDDIVRNYLEATNEKEGLKYLEETAKETESTLYDTYMELTLGEDPFEYAAAERKELIEKGYDAVEFVEGIEKDLVDTNKSNDIVSSYAIFNSNQLKSIDNKNPTSNTDIRYLEAKKTNTTEKGKTNAERIDAYIEQEIQKIEKTGKWDDSIPVTRRTDIRRTIEDYLGIGIQRGKFRERAYALYKGNRDVIRSKELKDIDSILHETGHALDLGNRLKINKESIADELLRAIDKYEGYETESREIQLEEGFAEVLREYAVVPEQAAKEYPQTTAIIKELRNKDNSFNNFIKDVQTQIYNYIHQNPGNRVLSNISIGEQTDKPKWTKEYIKQEVMRNIYDKDWTLKSAINELAKVSGKTQNEIKASENAYLLTRLANGIGDKVVSMLGNGYIDEKGRKLMPGLNQIGEILGQDAKRFNDLRKYLVAQRDLDYKAKTLKTGIRTMDSKAVVEQFKNDKPIQEAAKIVYDTLDGVMQYAVDNHLITKAEADNVKKSNAFYVPMHRVLENQGNKIGRKGAVSEIIKQRTGSELDIKDVLENILVNSSNVIQQVENNNVLKALYKQGELAGRTGGIYDVIDTPLTKVGTAQLELWERELKKQGVNTSELDLNKTIDIFAPNNKVDSKNLITSFINDNGRRVYLQFYDDVLFNSIMNMDKKFMSQVLKINSKLNMPLRFGATMANVGFAIPNIISDTAQASIYSTAGFTPVVDNIIGVLDILAANNKSVEKFVSKISPEYAQYINQMYTLYKQSGATSSTRLSQYRESSQNIMKELYGTKNKTLGIEEKYKPLKRLLDILTYLPELSEQSTRFRVFERNYEYYRKQGYSEKDARLQAALESRDATQDFSRTGNLTREINQVIPFSAARVGSAYTFAEKTKANQKRVAMRMAILTTIAMAIKAIGYDDDEIEELIQRKKDDNFVFKIGDKVITIKKPQGVIRSILNLTEYVQDLVTGHIEKGKEAEKLGEWINNAIMDNMPADEVTGLVPNAVAPIIENAINKDLYYNTDIVKSYDLDLPDAQQYYDYNSQLAILLGRVFNYSPAKIDNLISGYFAGLGTQVTNLMDYAMGKVGLIPEKPEMGAENDAVGKRFVVNVNANSASVNEVYNRRTELNKKKNGGTITKEEETELTNINSAISNLSKLNKQIKEIKADASMTGKEKAEEIKTLQKEKTDTARQALGKDLLYEESDIKITNTQFYPTNNTLKSNGSTLELTSKMKKEYEEYAAQEYNKLKKQGLYTEDKMVSTAKANAKKYMMEKYKNQLVKAGD